MISLISAFTIHTDEWEPLKIPSCIRSVQLVIGLRSLQLQMFPARRLLCFSTSTQQLHMQIHTLYSMVYEPDMTVQDRLTLVTNTWCRKMSASKDHYSLALNFHLHCFWDSSTASAALSNQISPSVEAASLQLGKFLCLMSLVLTILSLITSWYHHWMVCA